MQPEAKLQKKIVDALNQIPGAYCEKNHGGMYGKQKLDITGAINGKMFQIEIKMPGNKPTKRQIVTMNKWRQAGAIVGIATSVDEALNLIKENGYG